MISKITSLPHRSANLIKHDKRELYKDDSHYTWLSGAANQRIQPRSTESVFFSERLNVFRVRNTKEAV